MATMSLICEGVSEIKILTYIINRYLGDDIVVNPIQPSLKSINGMQKQAVEGGWLQVLNHCSDDTVKNIMAANDYLVIQIDTDACIQANYDVDIYDADHKKVPNDILYERVCDRLQRDISADVLNKYLNRIFFAICFNETECWLLPLYYENDVKKRCAVSNCIYILNQKLQNEGLGIPEDKKNSPEAVKTYQQILKRMKKKDIPKIAQYNFGFQKFIQQLDSINL